MLLPVLLVELISIIENRRTPTGPLVCATSCHSAEMLPDPVSVGGPAQCSAKVHYLDEAPGGLPRSVWGLKDGSGFAAARMYLTRLSSAPGGTSSSTLFCPMTFQVTRQEKGLPRPAIVAESTGLYSFTQVLISSQTCKM